MKGKGRTDPVLAELIIIKKLLVFQLLASGATQKQVGGILGIDHTRVSRMFPLMPKKLTSNAADEQYGKRGRR